MKVWIICERDYGYMPPLGVVSTPEKGLEYLQEHRSGKAIEWRVDKRPGEWMIRAVNEHIDDIYDLIEHEVDSPEA